MSLAEDESGADAHADELGPPADPAVRMVGEAEGQSETSGSPPRLGLSQREMNWAAAAHPSVVLTVLLGLATGGVGVILGLAVPAGIWYACRGKRGYVMEQARQATCFQAGWGLGLLALVLGGAFLLVAGWLVTAVLSVLLVGLLLIPLMSVVTALWVIALVALPIGEMVYGCYAAAEAHQGRPFRYRWPPWLAPGP